MLSGLDEQRIVRAIADAERGNRAEVRVHVEAKCSGPALERAARVYRALGLSRTQDDTAVLLYVAVKSRVAAVYSGKGVPDQREGFWQEIGLLCRIRADSSSFRAAPDTVLAA